MQTEIGYETEKDCFDKLMTYVISDGFKCRRCGCSEYWSKPERRILICKKCRKEISPLSETMFGGSHIPLVKWFELIKLMACSPDRVITARTAFEELGFGSYRTVWNAMNKIRFAISKKEPRRKLQGLIEFDEMVISGVGSEYNKLSILGALEIEGERRLTLEMIKNPDEMNLKVYLKRRFKSDATVITNPEKLYISNWLELNRISQKSSVEMYGNNFLNLHIILQDIRYGIRNGHHSVSEKYLQRNLDEFVFIFNHNKDRIEAFEILLNYMIKAQLNDYRMSERKKSTFFSIIRGNN